MGKIIPPVLILGKYFIPKKGVSEVDKKTQKLHKINNVRKWLKINFRVKVYSRYPFFVGVGAFHILCKVKITIVCFLLEHLLRALIRYINQINSTQNRSFYLDSCLYFYLTKTMQFFKIKLKSNLEVATINKKNVYIVQ